MALEKSQSSQSLAYAAYAGIRHRIIQSDLEPGRYITEAQLADELGIGKTPIREALGRLVQDGLVRVIPRQGYRVAPITLRDVHDIFGLRLIIEPAAVELAATRIDAAQLRRLEEVCEPDHPDNPVEMCRVNTAFHVTSAQAAGNRRLAESLVRLLDESERLYHLGFTFRNPNFHIGYKHHRELFAALAAGDGGAARQIAINEITYVRQTVIDVLLSSPALLETEGAVPQLRVISP